jgi:hypothetical protein
MKEFKLQLSTKIKNLNFPHKKIQKGKTILNFKEISLNKALKIIITVIKNLLHLKRKLFLNSEIFFMNKVTNSIVMGYRLSKYKILKRTITNF